MHAYSPMREPRKEVTEEQMKETLARRVRESIQRHAERVSVDGSGVAQSSRAPAVPLRQEVPGANPVAVAISWEKPVRTSDDGLGYQRSTCGRFVIAKVRVNREFRYTASRCRADLPAQVLGSFANAADAQKCCEGHR